jgi:2-polyprenyl-3-methyl-5-hydroxy-6-metoxy-1,4-benzoquinol methylase
MYGKREGAHNYVNAFQVPWNSGAPDSHLMQYIADLEARRAELGRDTWFPQSSLEVGCGFGATTRWLASKGLIRCVGVDLVAAPIDEGNLRD